MNENNSIKILIVALIALLATTYFVFSSRFLTSILFSNAHSSAIAAMSLLATPSSPWTEDNEEGKIAPPFREAFEIYTPPVMAEVSFLEASTTIPYKKPYFTPETVSGLSPSALRPIVETRQKFIEKLTEAIRETSSKTDDLFSATSPFPVSSTLLQMAQVVVASCQLDIQTGHKEQAFEKLLLLRKWADQLSRGAGNSGTIRLYETSLDIRLLASYELFHFFCTMENTGEKAEPYLRRLQSFNSCNTYPESYIEGELNVLKKLYDKERRRYPVSYFFVELFQGPTEESIKNFLEEARNLLALPYHEKATAMNQLKEDFKSSKRCNIFASAYATDPMVLYHKLTRAIMLENASAVILLLYMYKKQNGNYPQEISALASLGMEVPADPMSGSDFIYRQEQGLFKLYSVGTDRSDDGGNLHSDLILVSPE